jgi:hypothetical protein
MMRTKKQTQVLKIAVYVVMAVLLLSGLAIPLSQRGDPSPGKTSPAATAPEGVHATSRLPGSEQPVDIISVTGPLPPISPGGPVVSVGLVNVSNESIMTLSAILHLDRDFEVTFDSVTPSKPLRPGQQTTGQQILIGGGFADNVTYRITVSGTFESEAIFAYTEDVQIQPPAR